MTGDKRFAYTAIVDEGGFRIGRADEGVPGYTPLPDLGEFESYEKAAEKAEELNTAGGLEKLEAFRIVASTMWPQGGRG